VEAVTRCAEPAGFFLQDLSSENPRAILLDPRVVLSWHPCILSKEQKRMSWYSSNEVHPNVGAEHSEVLIAIRTAHPALVPLIEEYLTRKPLSSSPYAYGAPSIGDLERAMAEFLGVNTRRLDEGGKSKPDGSAWLRLALAYAKREARSRIPSRQNRTDVPGASKVKAKAPAKKSRAKAKAPR